MQVPPENNPIIPRRAPVRPRVHPSGKDLALPIEDYIHQLLEKKTGLPVNIYGPPGSGKSTALAHIAAVFGDSVYAVDGPWPGKRNPHEATALEFNKLVVYATQDAQRLQAFGMARWTRDDVIEYLLAGHPAQCRSVMERLADQGDELLGAPELWVIVLEQFLADPALADLSEAIRRHVATELGDLVYYREVAHHALEKICQHSWVVLPEHLAHERSARLLDYPAVTVHLASDALCKSLAAQESWALAYQLPLALLTKAAPLLRHSPERVAFLVRSLRQTHLQSTAASLLIRADRAWRPDEPLRDLSGAQLQNARWSAVNLSKSDLRRVNFSDADLSGANLSRADALQANFSRARLCGAVIDGFLAQHADLSRADFTGARGDGALFNDATLTRASLRSASLSGASFSHTDLIGCDLSSAILADAQLNRAQVDEADFTGAILDRAKISHISFHLATLDRASFAKASLVACNFEGLKIDAANFCRASLKGCLFTSSVMRGANFSGADLRRTGLADVDWEGADLRNADLSEASFHMGSSRSGLVHSDIASEGTRTGFYTDDYNDQDFKAPEEIRKADLCGCDLRGANIEHTDFYLVDLRGAKYTDAQRQHFARCGAILRSRV